MIHWVPWHDPRPRPFGNAFARANVLAVPGCVTVPLRREKQEHLSRSRHVLSRKRMNLVVKGNADEPPRDSSIATKSDTPLLETPRSVSILDNRTLDDMVRRRN